LLLPAGELAGPLAPIVFVLLKALTSDKTEATRTGILRALAEGKYSDVGPAVQSCLADKSWDVRRRAIQALVAGKTPGIEDLIAPACSDPEPGVRLTAIDALVNLGSQKVVAPAIVELGDSTWQVRKSAIDALTRVRSLDAIEPLIKALEKEEGINVPDIGEALASLTGKEFGAAVDKWKAWWAEAKAGFALPAPEAIAYDRFLRVVLFSPSSLISAFNSSCNTRTKTRVCSSRLWISSRNSLRTPCSSVRNSVRTAKNSPRVSPRNCRNSSRNDPRSALRIRNSPSTRSSRSGTSFKRSMLFSNDSTRLSNNESAIARSCQAPKICRA
jgi:hypothetical protein